MYHIIRINGESLGVTDSVNYIKIGASGDFANASAADAIGVAFQNIPYNLRGHSAIADAETVIVSEIDSASFIAQKVIESEQAITDLDIANIEAQQGITELDLKILEV